MTLLGRAAPMKARRKKGFSRYKQRDTKIGDRVVKTQGYEPQAIKYLTEVLGFDPKDIKCEQEFGDTLRIRYSYNGKVRTYLPDIYVVPKRLIVEVKSAHTLGLLSNKKRGWSMTCAKALECHKRGFKFMLLLLDRHGNRLRLPKNWAKMKKHEVVTAVEELNPQSERSGLFQL